MITLYLQAPYIRTLNCKHCR